MEIADLAEVRGEGRPFRSVGQIEHHYLTWLVVVLVAAIVACWSGGARRARVPPRCHLPRVPPAAFSSQEGRDRCAGTPSGPARGSRARRRRGPARLPGIRDASRSLLTGWGDAVVTAAADQRRAPDGAETVPGVVVAPGLELEGGAPRRLRGLCTACADGRSWHRPSVGVLGGGVRHGGRRPSGRPSFRSGAAPGPRPPAWPAGRRAMEAPPAPPDEVQARTSRRTRSGCRMASSWATMPPKEIPHDEAARPSPVAANRAAASSPYSAIV